MEVNGRDTGIVAGRGPRSPGGVARGPCPHSLLLGDPLLGPTDPEDLRLGPGTDECLAFCLCFLPPEPSHPYPVVTTITTITTRNPSSSTRTSLGCTALSPLAGGLSGDVTGCAADQPPPRGTPCCHRHLPARTGGPGLQLLAPPALLRSCLPTCQQLQGPRAPHLQWN